MVQVTCCDEQTGDKQVQVFELYYPRKHSLRNNPSLPRGSIYFLHTKDLVNANKHGFKATHMNYLQQSNGPK